MIAIHPDPTRVVDAVERFLTEPVSAPRINLFHCCMPKFYFSYVRKLTKPSSPSLYLSKAVQAMLQEWSKRRWMGKPAHKEDLFGQFNEQWQFYLKDEPVSFEEGELEAEKHKAWALAEMFLRETPISVDEKPLRVEVSVDADLSEQSLPSLRGIIDLVRSDGEIVDLQT